MGQEASRPSAPESLGAGFQLKLHLIGTSPQPRPETAWHTLDDEGLAQLRSDTIRDARQSGEKPDQAWELIQKAIEIDRTLRDLAADGIQATYHRCDVSDRDALANVLAEVRKADGPIAGILHGAGIDRSCRYEKKTSEDVKATFDAKVLGAYNLMLLTQKDPVGHFIGFGSVSGRLGGNGQTDYCAASELLCKLISWYGRQRSSCHAVSFHWHPWDEVGMACRPETRANLEANRLNMMPKREGLWHFLRELVAGPSDTEVLITEWKYHQRFYPANVRQLASQFESGQRLPFPGKVEAHAADRMILRMVDAPLAQTQPSQPRFSRSALILGDNADAHALRDHLASEGMSVELLPVVDDPDQLIARLEAIWKSCPVDSLFLMTARDAADDQWFERENWNRRLACGVQSPILFTQRWCQLVAEENFDGRATLVAATSLGGDFGFGGHVASPDGGALSGLLKSIHVQDARHDHARYRVKVIDSPADENPFDLASAIHDELSSDQKEVEVSWTRGRRQSVQCRREPASELPRIDLPRGGTWIVTGGGRGITAFAAFHLARRYGLKLHLIGKTPLPEKDAPWLNCTDDELKSIKARIVSEAVSQGRSPEDDWGQVRKSPRTTRLPREIRRRRYSSNVSQMRCFGLG